MFKVPALKRVQKDVDNGRAELLVKSVKGYYMSTEQPSVLVKRLPTDSHRFTQIIVSCF